MPAPYHFFSTDLPGAPEYIAPKPNAPTTSVPPPTAEQRVSYADLPSWLMPSPKHQLFLPNPIKDPGLYAAAVDAINAAHAYFASHGYCPTPEGVSRATAKFTTKYKDESKHDPVDYLLPPDLRLLYCKRPGTGKHRAGPLGNGKRLWEEAIRAANACCGEDLDYALSATRHIWLQDMEKTDDSDEQRIVRLFGRYIIMAKHAKARETSPDIQPSASEMDKFIRLGNYNKTEGLTLAILHQRFLNVKNIAELVRRVQRFCDFDPDQGTFVPKPQPNEKDIQAALKHEALSFPDLLHHFRAGVGSEFLLRQTLGSIAKPDYATGLWVLHGRKPDSLAVLRKISPRGSSVHDLAMQFPGEVGNVTAFRLDLHAVAYPLPPEPKGHRGLYHGCDGELWFPKYPDGKGGLLGAEDSKKMVAIQRMLFEKPAELLAFVGAGAQWDARAGVFVEKEVAAEVQVPSPEATPPSGKRKRAAGEEGEKEAVAGEERASRPAKKTKTKGAAAWCLEASKEW